MPSANCSSASVCPRLAKGSTTMESGGAEAGPAGMFPGHDAFVRRKRITSAAQECGPGLTRPTARYRSNIAPLRIMA